VVSTLSEASVAVGSGPSCRRDRRGPSGRYAAPGDLHASCVRDARIVFADQEGALGDQEYRPVAVSYTFEATNLSTRRKV